MKLMYSLALRQLKENRRRTLFTLAGIIISVAMLVAVSGFVESAKNSMYTLFMESTGGYHAEVQVATREEAERIIAHPDTVDGWVEESQYEEGIYLAAFRLKEPTNAFDRQVYNLLAECGVNYLYVDFNTEVLAMEGYVASNALLTALYTLAALVIFVIAAGSVIVISNAFAISAGERAQQFGVLKSIGATREQVRLSIMCEGLLLSAAGIPLGTLLGVGVQAGVLSVANLLMRDLNKTQFGGRGIHFQAVFSPLAIVIAVLLAFVTIMFSAWRPAAKAARVAAIDAIRGTGEVKIKPRQVKTGRLTQKVFGFEGALASKTLKRSRRKYRATVMSLALSVVLFIASTGLGNSLQRSVSMMYPVSEGNLFVLKTQALFEDSMDYTAKIEKMLAAEGREEDTMMYVGSLMLAAEFPQEMVIPNLEEYLAGGPELVGFSGATILYVDEATYAQLCGQAGVEVSNDGAILVNRAIGRKGSARVVFSPFVFAPTTITLTDTYSNTEYLLPLVGEVTVVPERIMTLSPSGNATLVVSNETAARLCKDTPGYSYWYISTQDPEKTGEALEEIFASAKGTAMVVNVGDQVAAMKSLNALIMMLVYGFIFMLTAIGVTSVINAVSANIRLRQREFATLSAVGMTPEGVKRMLNLESLFYSIRAILYGLPIGVLLSYLMFRAIAGVVDPGGFLVPWAGILISTAGVIMISFVSMRYAARVLYGRNIVETIRRTSI